jgi:putative transposase
MSYFSVAQLAKILGVGERAVRKRSHQFTGGRPRAGKKGLEYPLSGLPADYRQKLSEKSPLYIGANHHDLGQSLTLEAGATARATAATILAHLTQQPQSLAPANPGAADPQCPRIDGGSINATSAQTPNPAAPSSGDPAPQHRGAGGSMGTPAGRPNALGQGGGAAAPAGSREHPPSIAYELANQPECVAGTDRECASQPECADSPSEKHQSQTELTHDRPIEYQRLEAPANGAYPQPAGATEQHLLSPPEQDRSGFGDGQSCITVTATAVRDDDEATGSREPGDCQVGSSGSRDYRSLSADWWPDAPGTATERRAQAKAEILAKWKQCLKEHEGDRKAYLTTERFCRDYSGGRIALPAWVYKEIKSVSWGALTTWRKREHELGLKGLKRKGFSKMGKLSEAQREFAQNQILALPHLGAKMIWRELQTIFDDVPSETCVRNFYNNFRANNAELVAYAESPEEWRGRHKKAYGSYAPPHYGARWEIDSTISDVRWELQDDLGGFRRYALVVAVDAWSRQAKVLVCENSNSEAIGSLVRECLLDWGVPDQIKSDNGKDYLSRHVLNLLRNLGIDHKACDPFSPWQKPYVERFNRTLQHSPQFLMHPRYLGHSVVVRQKIRARELFKEVPRGKKANTELEIRRINRSIREFQGFVEAAVAEYNNSPHSSLPVIVADGKKRTLTPNERAATARHERKNIEDPRALDVLLYPAVGGKGWRSLQGKQGIRIGNLPDGQPAYYFSDKLEGIAAAHSRAYVKLDPTPGFAHLFDGEGCETYLGMVECFGLTGGNRMPAIAAAKAAQKERAAQVAEARRAVRKHLRVVEPGEAAEVISLRPGQEKTTHSTPALESAASAAKAEAARPLSTATRFDEVPERPPEPVPASGFVELLPEEVWPRVLSLYLAGDLEAIDPREGAFVSVTLSERAGKWRTWQSEAVNAGLAGDAWWDFVDWCLQFEQPVKEVMQSQAS